MIFCCQERIYHRKIEKTGIEDKPPMKERWIKEL